MKKNILIIDDDVELSEEIAEILRDEGHSVHAVSDGIQGEAYIRNYTYDIVILDYKMPGLNGIDVLKGIKGKNVKAKILISSGKPFIDELLKNEDLSDLVTSVLAKPFDAKALLEKINAS